MMDEFCARNKPHRQDRRTWRDVLREYHGNAGRHVPVTLPRLRFQEKEVEDERERAA